MKIVHVIPGIDVPTNGIANAAKRIAVYQRDQGHEVDLVEAKEFAVRSFACSAFSLSLPDEVWVHSNWWPPTLMSCWRVIRAGVPLVRMTHANLDPLRYHSKWWKKAMVAPIERWLYRRTARVVVTCEAERAWCQHWGVKGPFEVLDMRRLYNLAVENRRGRREGGTPLHVLFLGRSSDPLKGVRYLEQAVKELNSAREGAFRHQHPLVLRIVSSHFDAELEEDWNWCDVLCLPTLSENFGLVVAEALERGKRVITTDGAPAWEQESDRLVYLRGYRDGSDATRVELLKKALQDATPTGLREV